MLLEGKLQNPSDPPSLYTNGEGDLGWMRLPGARGTRGLYQSLVLQVEKPPHLGGGGSAGTASEPSGNAQMGEHLNGRLCYITHKAFHSGLSLCTASGGKLSFAGE